MPDLHEAEKPCEIRKLCEKKLKRTPMKRNAPNRDWRDAETKRGPCRVCGHSRAELAHTIGRDMDAVLAGPRGGMYRYVHPDSVVPLCPAHHEQFDARRLDLLPCMTIDEQLNSVEAAGGIVAAYERLTGEKL